MWPVPRSNVPDWVELEEGEVPLGFLDDDDGLAVLSCLLDYCKLPVVEAVWRQVLMMQAEKREKPRRRKRKWCEVYQHSVQKEKDIFSGFKKVLRKMGGNPTIFEKEDLTTVDSETTTTIETDPATSSNATANSLSDQKVLETNTMRKSAARKVKPVDDAPPDGSVPEGNVDWKRSRLEAAKLRARYGHRWDKYVLPRFSSTKPGSRLRPERLKDILDKATILTPQEKEFLSYVLFCREEALAWEFSECGRIDPEVVPPQKIRTVPHKAWQSRSIPIPKPLMEKVIQILRERIERRILERSHASYRNNWFLVQKKDGGLRLINDAQKINGVTIRDALIPPGADEFSEEFGGCLLLSLLDLFSGYDQIELHPESRDLTTFATPLGLFRYCTIPMGGTNSVAQFMRAMNQILSDLIPHICRAFLDDLCVKAPRTDYDNEEIEPGIRRYVFEHILNINAVLLNCELAGATVSGAKSQWCQRQATVVGYLCTPEGRAPDQKKVIKINEWRVCIEVHDVRSFLGIVGFYRIWIKDYGIIARPLFDLLKKKASWVWTEQEQGAMEYLQWKITSAPILATLVYDDPRYGAIFLMVDASLIGWGGVIEQVGPDKKRHPCRFESGVWSPAETRYDATKRELRGLLYALKRCRRYLFGVHFTIETDALVLVHQLNGAASDVPGALLMRWIAWIRLFDFDIKHIPGSKNAAADGLSRKPPGPSDLREKEEEEDIDDWVDAQIYTHEVARSFVTELREAGYVLEGEWSEESRQIARFLTTFTVPSDLKTRAAIQSFKTRALNFFVSKGKLWRRPKNSRYEPKLVVDSVLERKKIFEELHRKVGHKGRDETYRRVHKLYFWKGLYKDVQKWVQACPECQKWDPRRFEEPAQHTQPSALPWARWSLDIQYLPSQRNKRRIYCVEARDDLTGYPEACLSGDRTAAKVFDFIYENILSRWGWPLLVTIDGGSEFKGEVKEGLEAMRIKRVNISPYNSRANGQVEAGHFTIASALAKLDTGQKGGLNMKLAAVLYADRTTTRASHGMTPFWLAHGYDPISPIEIDVPSWRMARWDCLPLVTPESSEEEKKKVCEELVQLRAKILLDCVDRHEEAAKRVSEARRTWAERRNRMLKYRMRPSTQEIKKGDLVLVYDEVRSIDMSTARKLQSRWHGPYRVREVAPKRVYLLQTLDGIPIVGSFPPTRIKKFFQLDGVLVTEDDSTMQPNHLRPLDPTDQKGEGSGAQEIVIEEEVVQAVPGRVERLSDMRPTTRSQTAAAAKAGRPQLVVELRRGKPPGWKEGLPSDQNKTKGRESSPPSEKEKEPGVVDDVDPSGSVRRED